MEYCWGDTDRETVQCCGVHCVWSIVGAILTGKLCSAAVYNVTGPQQQTNFDKESLGNEPGPAPLVTEPAVIGNYQTLRCYCLITKTTAAI